MPLLEELSNWICPYCEKTNDVTNPTRCWNCNKAKLTLKKYKALMKKRTKLANEELQKKKAEIVSKIENVEPKDTEMNLEFDLSKLDPTL